MAEIFMLEEKIINIISRSSSYENVEIYMASWTSRYNELKLSHHQEDDYYEDVLVKLVGNPLHVFSLLDRLVILLPSIMEGLADSDKMEITNLLSGLAMSAHESDVEAAVQAIIRVQFAYKSVEERKDEDVTSDISVWTPWT